MAVNLMPDVLIRQFGTAASRLATATRSVERTADVGLLRMLGDELITSYARATRIAPESMHGVSVEAAEELSSAIRGVQALRAGGDLDSTARLASLADAAQGLFAEALRSMPTARPVRVVVGGGGPGGLATANLLRKMGADVTVAHPGATDWRTGILIERRAWDILRQTGGEELLRVAPVDDAGTSIMAPLSLVDSELSAHAKQIGVDVLDTHRVRSATTLDGGAVVSIQNDATGATRNVDADWYVDATGGASPVAHQARFKRRMFEGTFGALPQKRLFMRQSATAIDSAAIGWNGPNDAFVVNDKLAGTLMAYRPIPRFVRGHTLSAEEGLKMLDSVGVDRASAIGTPAAVMARQRLAPAAADGRVLMVGDSVGSVMPVTQAGVLLALLDARRAAEMIAASRGAMTSVTDEAVRALDDLVRNGASASDDAVRQLGIEASATADSAVGELVSSFDAETVNTHRLFLA